MSFFGNLVTFLVIFGCLLLLSQGQQGLTQDKEYISELIGISNSDWNNDLEHINSGNVDGDVQKKLLSSKIIERAYLDNNCKFTSYYRYTLSGVVAGVKEYDIVTDIPAPLDVCIAWGEAALPDNLEHFRFTMNTRFCNYRYNWPAGHKEISPDYINTHISNNHLIFSSDKLEKAAKEKIHTGDSIIVSGYLVDVHCVKSSGRFYKSRTSTTRVDSGIGACEIIYVQNLSVNGDVVGKEK